MRRMKWSHLVWTPSNLWHGLPRTGSGCGQTLATEAAHSCLIETARTPVWHLAWEPGCQGHGVVSSAIEPRAGTGTAQRRTKASRTIPKRE